METLKFKTTVKCSSCVAKVTPALDQTVGENNWDIDVQTPDKVLTVESDQEIRAEDVVKALEAVGYKAQKVD